MYLAMQRDAAGQEWLCHGYRGLFLGHKSYGKRGVIDRELMKQRKRMTAYRRITLRLMAEQLGIHVSTLSRVLNGTEEEARAAASPEVIERIRRLANEQGYRPNRQAIALKTSKSRLIGVALPRLTDLVVATIYEGIDESAQDKGYLTFVGTTLDIPERQREICEMALDQNVEGLIIGDARTDSLEFLDELSRRNVPFVLVSRHVRDYCAVTCDDIRGGELVADHLVGLGHKDIVVFAGESFASTGQDRTQGFVQRCLELGVQISESRIIHSGFDSVSGRKLGEQLFSREGPKPTAVFAVNDFLAIGLMGALRDCGIQVGRDVAVVGFNNTPLAVELPIGLSSIGSPMHQMGYLGTDLLLRMINGERPESIRLEPTLFVRESSLGQS